MTGSSEGTVGATGAGSDVPAFGGEPVATEPVAVRSRASHRRAQRAVQGRVGAVTAVAVLVLGVGLTSAVATTTTAPPVPPVGDATTVAPAGTLNSSLYCVTGAGVDAGEGATGMVVLTNSSRTAAVGFVTTVGTTGTTTASAVTVPALGSAVVTPAKDLSLEAHATTDARSPSVFVLDQHTLAFVVTRARTVPSASMPTAGDVDGARVRSVFGLSAFDGVPVGSEVAAGASKATPPQETNVTAAKAK